MNRKKTLLSITIISGKLCPVIKNAIKDNKWINSALYVKLSSNKNLNSILRAKKS